MSNPSFIQDEKRENEPKTIFKDISGVKKVRHKTTNLET